MPIPPSRLPPAGVATTGAERAVFAAAGLLLMIGVPSASSAQRTVPAAGGSPAVVEQAWSHPGPAVTGRDLATLGGALAAAAALMTVDERIARWSQRPTLQDPAAVRHTAAVFRALGDPGALALGGMTYVVGLSRRDRGMADVGLHTAGAVVVAGVVTGALKLAVGRARPYVTGDSNPHNFAFGRGLRGGNAYQAFPSGHATAAFAFASALSAEGRHRWPATNRVTEPIAYTAATLVAASRVYHDRHWASDVLTGAGVGFVTGRALVRYQHARPNNSADGRLLPPRTSLRVAGPVPASLRWSIAF